MLMQRLEADVFRVGEQYTARAATEASYKSVNDLKPKKYLRDCNFGKQTARPGLPRDTGAVEADGLALSAKAQQQ